MATQLPRDVYPFSDAAGNAIPLDIIRPASVARFSIVSNAANSFVLAEEDKTILLYSTVDAFLFLDSTFTPPLIDNTRYDDAIFVPAFTIITAAALPGTARIFASDTAGVFYIQVIDKWAAIGRDLNAIRR